MNMITCLKCHVPKPADCFHKRMHRCKECHYVMCRTNVNAHPEREKARRARPENKAYMRNYKLWLDYKITTDDYNQMFTAQLGMCAICGMQFSKRLCVGHDHKTGRVRQLLCRVCNNTVGWLEADPIRAYNAINYVETWKRIQQ